MNISVWIAILIVCIAVEAMTQGVISVWFAFGAAASVLAAYLGASVGVQWAVFAAVSFIMLAVTRPIVKKLMPSGGYTPTNQELDIGKTAVVTETVDNSANCGRVCLSGVDWCARSRDGDILPAGTGVVVTAVAATTLTVAPQTEPHK